MNTNEFISQYKVVPVVVFNSLDEVRTKLEAMVKGGLPIAEITYRTACAGDAIKIAVEESENEIQSEKIKFALKTVVNTYQDPEEINCNADDSEEMHNAKVLSETVNV